ncbi:MAG: hypothetical protein AB1791_17045 [Chloroflexota bacterium]
MPDQTITTMKYEAFQSLMDDYIDRSSKERSEMPASTFFELLFEQAARRVTETVEVEGDIVGNQLVLRVPAGVETAVQTRGNEIVVGNQRIVVRLRDGHILPKVG